MTPCRKNPGEANTHHKHTTSLASDTIQDVNGVWKHHPQGFNPSGRHKSFAAYARQRLFSFIQKRSPPPITPEVIESYIGCSIPEYINYIAACALRAGYKLTDFTISWHIECPTNCTTVGHHKLLTHQERCQLFHFQNHRPVKKYTYKHVFLNPNPVLINKITRLLEKMVYANIVKRHKGAKIDAKSFEKAILFLLNLEFSEENRQTMRICMDRLIMPWVNHSRYGYYTNIVISKDLLNK